MRCRDCSVCKHNSDAMGECRRNAPVLMTVTEPVQADGSSMSQGLATKIVWNFPAVHLDLCWCGEFRECKE